jgi:hypothetical protein
MKCLFTIVGDLVSDDLGSSGIVRSSSPLLGGEIAKANQRYSPVALRKSNSVDPRVLIIVGIDDEGVLELLIASVPESSFCRFSYAIESCLVLFGSLKRN